MPRDPHEPLLDGRPAVEFIKRSRRTRTVPASPDSAQSESEVTGAVLERLAKDEDALIRATRAVKAGRMGRASHRAVVLAVLEALK